MDLAVAVEDVLVEPDVPEVAKLTVEDRYHCVVGRIRGHQPALQGLCANSLCRTTGRGAVGGALPSRYGVTVAESEPETVAWCRDGGGFVRWHRAGGAGDSIAADATNVG